MQRSIEERAEATTSLIVSGGYNDSFRMTEAIKREFADVVETDSRVTALVEAARDCARTMDTWAENALTQREALEAVSVRNVLTTALKPFEK